MVDVANIIQNYVDLLIIQYADKPKARAIIELFVKELLANGVMFDVEQGYNVENTVGVQLDVIGKYVGVDRFYLSQDVTGVRFGYSSYLSDEPTDVTGYASAADFLTKSGDYLSASDILGNGYSLSDSDYRTIIYLKIFLNNSNFSNKEIDDILFKIFGTNLYCIDNSNMSIEYFTNSVLSLIVKVALNKGLLSAPMAVRINNLIQDNIYFGYSSAASDQPIAVTGYASVADFLTKSGMFLGNDNFIV